jgi:hypothetical protein
LTARPRREYASAVMFVRGRSGLGLWLVLALILLGLVSQHCVLPTSAEAVSPHHHDGSGAGDHDHAIHALPCDVVVAKAPSAAPALVLCGADFDLSTTLRYQADAQPVVSSVVDRAGPALYVLHASLLI